MTTPRELTVLQAIADDSPALPSRISRQLGIGIGRAREVARYLTGRELIIRQRMANGQIIYTITDKGRRELDSHG